MTAPHNIPSPALTDRPAQQYTQGRSRTPRSAFSPLTITAPRSPADLARWYRLRHRVYAETLRLVPPSPVAQETDRHDPFCRTLLAWAGPHLVGGLRLLDHEAPTLAYTDPTYTRHLHGASIREVMRLIVDTPRWFRPLVLRHLFRATFRQSAAHRFLVCAARPHHVALYRRLGFARLGYESLLDYPLAGTWFPLALDLDAARRGDHPPGSDLSLLSSVCSDG